MALVQDSAWSAIVSFTDNDANIARFGLNVIGTDDYDAAYTKVSAVATAAAALSNGQIYSISLSKGAFEDALNYATISESSDVERKLVVQMRGDDPNIKTKIEVPSVNNAFIVDGSNVADVNNATVAALVTALVANAVTNRGEALTMVQGVPHKIHRKSSKG